MEVSSPPFLNQEDYSHFQTLLQEIDNNNDLSTKRRTRSYDENQENKIDVKKTKLENGRLSSFISLHEEEDNQTSNHEVAGVPATGNLHHHHHHHQQQRRLWVKDRSTEWWDICNHPLYPDEEFKRAFKMSKSTFNFICNELEPIIEKKNTTLRNAIPVSERVAVCIWRLATGEPLRKVSERFGRGISTCHKLVLEVCSAIKTVLMPKFLQWPDETKSNQIKKEFKSISGIPNIIGAVYTMHIPIIAPKENGAWYFNKRRTEKNQKSSYSITVQAVVGPDRVLTDVCIGMPGSMTVDKVLEKSGLYERASRGDLKGVWIVGNSGFPLLDWMLVPYERKNLTWGQDELNEKIEGAWEVGREAVRRLKGRWSCLRKRTEVKLQELPVVLGACCVLHNMCEMRGEEVEEEEGKDLEGYDEDGEFLRNFDKSEVFDDEMVIENGAPSLSAVRARDIIAHDLLHHGFGAN